MENKSWIRRAGLALGLVAVAVLAHAYYVDNILEAGVLHMLASGIRVVDLITSTTTNELDIVSAANNSTAVVVSTNGFVSFHTAALCQTETAGRKGELMYQSTANLLAISTGTGKGAFVIVSSMTAAAGSVVVCP